MTQNENLLKNCFKELKDRGYYYQSTGEEDLEKLLTEKPTTIYLGIDPTADSLHIGHCFPLFMLRPLQKAGHKIVIILGGATAMIGDPSGKDTMRNLVDQDFVNKNFEKIEKIISRFLSKDGNNPYILLNNADWYKGYDYINFMRDIGVHFNVNKMLATDAYAKRIEEGGLTFFEMGYMLMQAYDFVYLNRNHGVKLQVGGSDQWANMLAGAELGRKLNNMEGKPKEDFQAFTVPLLTTSEGKKMGKTEKGAIWVDENKTSPFEFYQYFYNVDDKDVEKLFKTTTELSLSEIAQIMKDENIVAIKKRYAYEITKSVHGKEKADIALQTAQELFEKGNSQNAPVVEVENSALPKDICDIAVIAGIEDSKGKVRKLIVQSGLSLNGEKIESADLVVDKALFEANGGELLLKKGKKTFVKVVLK